MLRELYDMYILNELLKDVKPIYSPEENKSCEIIDIANEEMKNIDSTEIDTAYKKTMTSEYTQKIINLIANNVCTEKDLEEYKKIINDTDLLDLRISNKSLYIKTKKGIIPYILSQMMSVDEECIEEVPITGKYMFFVINCSQWATPIQAIDKKLYSPQDLILLLKNIGSGKQEQIHQMVESELEDLIIKGLEENWEQWEETMYIQVGLEEQVVAIGFDMFIPNAKEVIANALGLNPKMFIEVSTFASTVLLIDTRRWVLEDFGDEEWHQ